MRVHLLAFGVMAAVASSGACSSTSTNTDASGSAGTGGGGSTGTAGADAGAAGTGGAAGAAFTAVAPCTAASDYATTGTTITVSPDAFVYTPNCLKVPVGATVMIGASTIHPLSGTTAGSPNNPIPLSQTTPASVTFPTAGFYSFQCDVHFSIGMKGVIWVGP